MKLTLELQRLHQVHTDLFKQISEIYIFVILLSHGVTFFSSIALAQKPEPSLPQKQIEEMGPAIPAPAPPSSASDPAFTPSSEGLSEKESVHFQGPPNHDPNISLEPPAKTTKSQAKDLYPPSQGLPDTLNAKTTPTVSPMQKSVPLIKQTLETGFQSRGEIYIYDPSGRRDPFKPYSIFKAAPQLQVEPNKAAIEVPLDPLQRYDLPQFKVLGIIWNTNRPRAMIADPSGKVHVVSKLQRLGRNNGYIAAIREGEIVVVESFEEQGKIQKNFRVLSMKK